MPARRLILPTLAAVAFVGSPLAAQSPPPTVTLTPISDLRSDWLNEGAQSPNGRFFILRSFATDFVRYDRSTKQWATAANVALGGQVRWSPDGRFIAYVRAAEGSRDLFVWILP